MKKVLVFFTILIVLCTMFISVYAYSDLITINSGPFDKVVNVSSEGNFRVTNSINATGDIVTYSWQCSLNDGESWFTINNSYGNSRRLDFGATYPGRDYLLIRCILTDSNGDSITSGNALIDLTPFNLLNFVSNSLSFVTSWIGDIVSSLTTGALSGLLPILAIGIAVAALLVIIKIIKLLGVHYG